MSFRVFEGRVLQRSDTTGFELNKRVRVLSREASLSGKSNAASATIQPVQTQIEAAKAEPYKHSSSESSSDSEDDETQT